MRDKYDIIKNKADLSTTPLRSAAVSIVEAGIASVLPDSIMHSSIGFDTVNRLLSVNGQQFDLSRGRLFVVGGGKASSTMALALEEIVGTDVICCGIVADKYGATPRTQKIEVFLAGHPVPDENGISAVRSMLSLKEQHKIAANDIVLCLISGGGSALMPAPVRGITLEEKQRVTSLLLNSGADISEINCIRKHLSVTKGGQLGRYFAPATVVSLILSDVIGNDLSVIASGPTYPDPSTFAKAQEIITRYELTHQVPESIITHLKNGAAGLIDETPKNLDNCRNFVIGDNLIALNAMSEKATLLGFHSLIITAEQKGETGSVARQRAKEILTGKYHGYDAIILGGETTPILPSPHGRGGRNQHFAAVSLVAMRDAAGSWLVASVGTDGSDFLPEVAGALVDDSLLRVVDARGLHLDSYVTAFDSYGLFSQLPGSLVNTGSTGTNVGDVILYLIPG